MTMDGRIVIRIREAAAPRHEFTDVALLLRAKFKELGLESFQKFRGTNAAVYAAGLFIERGDPQVPALTLGSRY